MRRAQTLPTPSPDCNSWKKKCIGASEILRIVASSKLCVGLVQALPGAIINLESRICAKQHVESRAFGGPIATGIRGLLMKKVWLRSAALAAFIAGSAQAADLKGAPIYKAVAPAYDWTGFYAGLNAGVGASQTNGSTDSEFPVTDRAGVGFAGGLQAGFNWQFAPNWVTGIEGDIGYLGIDRSFKNWITVLALGVKTDWYGTLRGRVGYTNGPSLFYATGGAAFVKLKNSYDFFSSQATLASKSATATGWTVGGGIETILGGNWSAKAEYLYIDVGSADVFNAGFEETAHFDNHFHIYRYGVNYKFGGPSMGAGLLRAHDWTGFYAGLSVGAGLSQDVFSAPTDPNAGASADIAYARVTGSLQAGYNWQFGPNWVAGLEGDIGYLGNKRAYIFLNDGAPTASGFRTNWYGTARGRLGYNTGQALLYVTGGAAFVNVKNNFDDTVIQRFASRTETAGGWTVGGGIEAALTQCWTAKAEYLYIDAGSQDVSNPSITRLGAGHFENRFHIFRYGLNYKFGG